LLSPAGSFATGDEHGDQEEIVWPEEVGAQKQSAFVRPQTREKHGKKAERKTEREA
jgi:hypothetical protein